MSLQNQVLNIAIVIARNRWSMYEQAAGSVSFPLIVMLVFWRAVTLAASAALPLATQPLQAASLSQPWRLR